MIVEALNLENFRNFSRAGLNFSCSSVFFEGANGQGKTSLLEAVFYAANLRSFRTSKLNEIKKIGTPSFHVSLKFRRPQGWSSLLEVDAGQVRTLRVDRVPVSRASDFTGKIKTVAFLPDDPLIVSGPSALRRRFFDMFISMLDRNYFSALQNYSQALRSRNFLLKNRNRDMDILNSYFQIWMRYVRETEEKETYLKKITADIPRDCLRGQTSFGPHLDDFEFISDDKPLRSFGSRGQCRMTSLILKLAELETVRQMQGALKDTVVLVDDATADLDIHAREAFLSKIRDAGQTFFAFTEIPPEFKSAQNDVFRVEAGTVK